MCNETIKQSTAKPWLSVIVPIYNTEKYLPKCLDSILGQTYTNFELLLIDDGSTDSCSEICKAYASKDNRIRYYRKTNGGLFHTRLYGAQYATGTYILFCDSDDYYTNNKVFRILYENATKHNCLAIQFGFLKKYNHLKRSVPLVKQTEFINQNNFNVNEYPGILCNNWNKTRLEPTVFNKLYHHSLLSKLPNPNSAERIFWGEDIIINLHLLHNCESMLYIPDTLYTYRNFTGGTNRFSLRTMNDLDKIKEYQLKFLNLRTEEGNDRIKSALFLEVAHWFYIYISQAQEHLSEQELKKLVAETLALPSFVTTRKYYLNNPKESDPVIDLIKLADPDEYIKSIKEYKPNTNLKTKIISAFKQLYKKI